MILERDSVFFSAKCPVMEFEGLSFQSCEMYVPTCFLKSTRCCVDSSVFSYSRTTAEPEAAVRSLRRVHTRTSNPLCVRFLRVCAPAQTKTPPSASSSLRVRIAYLNKLIVYTLALSHTVFCPVDMHAKHTLRHTQMHANTSRNKNPWHDVLDGEMA